MNENKLYAALLELRNGAHDIAVEHGWWNNDRPESEALLKIVVEVAEAVQALEKGNPPDKHLPHFDSVTVELADVIIRAMDLAGAMFPDVPAAVVEKMAFNKGREYRHGKQF